MHYIYPTGILMVEKLPKKITPDPLVNVVAEIRFDSRVVHSEDFFNIFYPAFQSHYSNFKIRDELPKKVRSLDPTLVYRPDFTFFDDNISFSFGSNVAFIELNKGYNGWENFSTLIKSHFEILDRLKIISSLKRIGLRFINLFEGYNDLNDVLNFNEKLPIDTQLSQFRKFYKTEVQNADMLLLIQIAEDSTLQKMGKTLKGTVLDIDSSISNNLPNEINKSVLDSFERLHTFEKSVFYSLIKQSYLEKLKIEY